MNNTKEEQEEELKKKKWEEMLIQHGWIKKKGWKVDNSMIIEDYDYTYFGELSDFCEEAEWYEHESWESGVDFDNAVEITLDWIDDAKREHYEEEEPFEPIIETGDE